MKKPIERIVKHVVEKNFPLFNRIDVISENNPFRYYKHGESGITYTVTLYIDFLTHLMNYIEIWRDIRDLIINTIKILGIDNTVKVLINFSDEK